jgi:hypothetical protein
MAKRAKKEEAAARAPSRGGTSSGKKTADKGAAADSLT